MNYRGSYRHLLRNSKAALLCAVEIYNKPRIQYRDECFVILLLNAWELILKALVSKHKKSIFYPKKRGESYKTLSWVDAFSRATPHFPAQVLALPVQRNIEMLSTYRDNAVHFYNDRGFSSVVYLLAQTSIVNYKDLLQHGFGEALSDEINWALLPLGTSAPVSPLAYLSGKAAEGKNASSAVKQFLQALSKNVDELDAAKQDTSRLLTVFNVKLESTKKIEKADIVVGVKGAGAAVEGPLTVYRTLDPNVSHPLRLKEVLEKVPELHGIKITTHVFLVIAHKFQLKSDPRFCWRATGGALTKYSHDLVARLRQVSKNDIETALVEYKTQRRALKELIG